MIKNLIIIILIITLQVIFASLNIKNVSDISLGFKVLKDVPVFITITVSFLLGALIFSPIAFFLGTKDKKPKETKKEIKNPKELLNKTYENKKEA
ncbi:MAG: hypothetical protein FWC36_09205 [Spirochaetes bacterium]|nr:hypothetical protein [Spirochaetota bacterium]